MDGEMEVRLWSDGHSGRETREGWGMNGNTKGGEAKSV